MKPKIILFVFLFIFGAVFLGTGLFLIHSQKHLREVCITEVQGTVTENEKNTFKDEKNISKTSYAPVFEYEYRDKTYKKKSDLSTNPPKYSVGEKIQVMINPDNPDEFYIPSDGKTKNIISYVCTAVGGFVIIYAPFAAFRKKED